MKYFALIFLVALLLIGCTAIDKTTVYQKLAESQPQVQEFLRAYPNSTVVVVYLDEAAFLTEMANFTRDCSRSFEPKPYYKVIMTSQEVNAVTLIDEATEKVVCALVHNKRQAAVEPADTSDPVQIALPADSESPAPTSPPKGIYEQPQGEIKLPVTNDSAQPVPTLPSQGNSNAQKSPIILEVGGHAVRGSGSPPAVTIIEFTDFQCPFCKQVSPTLKRLLQEYDGKVNLVLFHYPLAFHVKAQKAAEAFECARDQNGHWAMHDKIFEASQSGGTGLEVSDLKRYAVDFGMDAVTFNTCLDSGQKANLVAQDMAKLDSLAPELSDWGVDGVGTPFFFINGEPLVGAQPYEAFKIKVDAELNK